MKIEAAEMRVARDTAVRDKIGNDESVEPEAKRSKADTSNVGFKKEAYQRVLVNGTYSGLEDVLVAKFEKKKNPTVLFANDEASVFFKP